jgi:hypothetical protein
MTIIELATGVVAVCGAIGAVIHNSRCSKISCCGINCERDVLKQETTNDDDFSKAVEVSKLKPESKV